jgi:hypothetical protein
MLYAGDSVYAQRKLPKINIRIFKYLITHDILFVRYIRAYFLGVTERGHLFKVFCNDSKLVYQILVRPDNSYAVKPWYE